MIDFTPEHIEQQLTKRVARNCATCIIILNSSVGRACGCKKLAALQGNLQVKTPLSRRNLNPVKRTGQRRAREGNFLCVETLHGGPTAETPGSRQSPGYKFCVSRMVRKYRSEVTAGSLVRVQLGEPVKRRFSEMKSVVLYCVRHFVNVCRGLW